MSAIFGYFLIGVVIVWVVTSIGTVGWAVLAVIAFTVIAAYFAEVYPWDDRDDTEPPQ